MADEGWASAPSRPSLRAPPGHSQCASDPMLFRSLEPWSRRQAATIRVELSGGWPGGADGPGDPGPALYRWSWTSPTRLGTSAPAGSSRGQPWVP